MSCKEWPSRFEFKKKPIHLIDHVNDGDLQSSLPRLLPQYVNYAKYEVSTPEQNRANGIPFNRHLVTGLSVCRVRCQKRPLLVSNDTNGPNRTLATGSTCCNAARHCGHSCKAQHFVGTIVGIRTKPTFANFSGRCFRYSLVKSPTGLLESLKRYDNVGVTT